jgi:hypothetical protein
MIYEAMATKYSSSRTGVGDPTTAPPTPESGGTESPLEEGIVKYLQELRSWESGLSGTRSHRGRGDVVWYEHSWSHLLQSFFLLLSSLYCVLAFNLKSDLSQTLESQLQSQQQQEQELVNPEDTETTQLSQLSQVSDLSTISSVSQNGTKTKKKKAGKGGKKKRKREEESEEARLEREEKKKREMEMEARSWRKKMLTQILNEAQEFKAFCRKTRVGSLYEVSIVVLFLPSLPNGTVGVTDH